MKNNIINGYDNLQHNLIDLIREEEAKLGYRKENIRLYYPLSSLCHMFGCDVRDTSYSDMVKLLEGDDEDFRQYTDILGGVTFSNKKDRFCFEINENGVEYIHNNTDENEFIRKLVDLIRSHSTSMKDIIEFFNDSYDGVIIEYIKDGEFDVLIKFADKADDRYYYCFKDEGCHIIYHRFLPEDYEDLQLTINIIIQNYEKYQKPDRITLDNLVRFFCR